MGATAKGDGKRQKLEIEGPVAVGESAWFAAHGVAKKEEGEPDIQAHTNPVYALENGRPVRVQEAREAYANRWAAEVEYYRGAKLPFANDRQRAGFFAACERAWEVLRQ